MKTIKQTIAVVVIAGIAMLATGCASSGAPVEILDWRCGDRHCYTDHVTVGSDGNRTVTKTIKHLNAATDGSASRNYDAINAVNKSRGGLTLDAGEEITAATIDRNRKTARKRVPWRTSSTHTTIQSTVRCTDGPGRGNTHYTTCTITTW